MPYQADGVTTSDTGKNSWGASSERSDVDSRSNSITRISPRKAHDGREVVVPLRNEDSKHEKEGSHERRKSGGRGDDRGRMLLVSGMMGVKRHSLGTLRCGAYRI